MNQPLIVSALTIWLCGTAAAAASVPVDLTGKVTSADGTVLTNAHVFIYTAGPRVGTGYL
jgi:hypothetical protein